MTIKFLNINSKKNNKIILNLMGLLKYSKNK